MKKFTIEESAYIETTWIYEVEAENEEQAMEKFNTGTHKWVEKQENIGDMETVIDIYEIKE
jgi:hypothetical protein